MQAVLPDDGFTESILKLIDHDSSVEKHSHSIVTDVWLTQDQDN